MLDYNSNGETQHIFFRIDRYAINDNLAIQMFCKDADGFIEPFASLTVNLDIILPPNQAYLDTNNLGIEIGMWVENNKLGEYLGEVRQSGYCFYPLFEFDLEKVQEHGPR